MRAKAEYLAPRGTVSIKSVCLLLLFLFLLIVLPDSQMSGSHTTSLSKKAGLELLKDPQQAKTNTAVNEVDA